MDFEILDINNNVEEDIITVIDANLKTATLLKEEIKKLQQMNKQEQGKVIHKPLITSPTETKKVICNEENNDFEDEINYYLTEVNRLKKEETALKLPKVLPVRKNYNYQKILLRLKAEMLKNIKEIKELLEEEKDNISVEDIKLLKEDILLEKEKLNLIDKALNEKEQVIEEEQVENNLVFVPTSGGNIRVLEEIDKIPVEYHERFLGLLNSIKDGTFKNIKRFTSNNQATYGLYEVRDFKTRVVFDRIGENDYAIITIFIKKCDNDKGYIEQLKKKIAEYKMCSNMIKTKLQKEEFLLIQQDINTEIIEKLTKSLQKQKKKGEKK